MPCQAACPVGTEAWRYIAHIQRGEYVDAYRVIRDANPLPSVCARVCHHPCQDKCRTGVSGGESVEVRALKRFITDRIDPAAYRPSSRAGQDADGSRVAVVGSGPAGISAAHYLSLQGHSVTLFEAERTLGGMLVSGIPAYRLPREVLAREIATLLSGSVDIRTNTALGSDFTLHSLFHDGFKAVFLALGAHRSRTLNLDGENLPGVFSAMQFLKAFNLRRESLAKGHVGVVGGGNSAIDAARVALRQEKVKRTTILYRRTRAEMPAFDEEVEDALDDYQGAIIEPVFMSTSQAFRDSDEMAAALAYLIPSWTYSRIANPSTYYYEWVLALLEGYGFDGETACCSTSSGMAAIMTAVQPFLVHYPSFDGLQISALVYVPHNLERDARQPALSNSSVAQI